MLGVKDCRARGCARWPEEKVREHIRSLAGTHFDPQVADVLLNMDTVS
ncbi:MAG: hypothetical protein AAB427_06045 [Chloroflexota bacterium]